MLCKSPSELRPFFLFFCFFRNNARSIFYLVTTIPLQTHHFALPGFPRWDVAGGNDPLLHLRHWDVCIRSRPGFQGCVRPLRCLLESDQPPVRSHDLTRRWVFLLKCPFNLYVFSRRKNKKQKNPIKQNSRINVPEIWKPLLDWSKPSPGAVCPFPGVVSLIIC